MGEETEIWSQLPEPYVRYSVSTEGRVRNNETGYVFSEYNGCLDYPQVCLMSQVTKNPDSKRTHILVAQQFLGYTPEMQKDRTVVAHHINENKMDARLTNLKIITTSENNKLKNNGTGPKRPVLQFDMNGKFIAEYASAGEINSKWNRSNISNCCAGNLESAYGFIFRHKSDIDLEGEEWKEKLINNKLIKVSNMGRIETPTGKITFGYKSVNGYMRMNIVRSRISVHRIICEVFHPTYNSENFIVNHINHIKNDNRAENLEWTTPKGNYEAYMATNPYLKSRNVIRRPVVRINNDNSITNFKSIVEAIENTDGTSEHNIYTSIKNNSKIINGHGWMYIEDYNEKIKNKESIIFIDEKIVCIYKNNTIKIYNSLSEAIKNNKINNILLALLGKYKTVGGYKWMYLSKYNNLSDDEKINIFPKIDVSIVGISNNGPTIYSSIEQATEETGAPCIGAVLAGKIMTSGGYKWMKLSDYEKKIKNGEEIKFIKKIANEISVVGISENGSVKIYNSITEAKIDTGANNISSVLSGKSQTSGRHKWMTVNDYNNIKGKDLSFTAYSKPSTISVVGISEDGTVKTYSSIYKAKKETGAGHILDVLLGNRKTSGEMKWMSIDDYEK